MVLEGGHAVPVHRDQQDPAVIFNGCLGRQIEFGRIHTIGKVIKYLFTKKCL